MLKISVDEVSRRVESLQDEVVDLKKELASLRAQQAMSTMESQLSAVEMVQDVNVLAMEIPNADANTLRSLADKFREKYPRLGVAVLSTSTNIGQPTIISFVTEDVVKRGIKAGELITAIGGRGGGRPNMAQGSLPDGAMLNEAMAKVAKAVEDRLK
jgi:alanyl-tRNA synthetase